MNNPYSKLATLAAGLVLAAVIVEAVYRFVGPVWMNDDSATTTAARPTRTPEYRVDAGSIVAAHLFGRQRQAVVRRQEAPVTRLELRLLGVFSSPNDAYARALIAVGGDRGEAYRVGDQIPNTDAKLHEIGPQLVLLDREGRLERLELIRENVIDAPPGEDQDPSTLPVPSSNDVEVIHEERPEDDEPLRTDGDGEPAQTGDDEQPATRLNVPGQDT